MIRYLAASLLFLLPGSAALAQEPAAPAPDAADTKATYSGSKSCADCHDDIAKAIAKSPHGAVDKSDRHGFTGNACEACHGPGSKHVDSISPADILNPAKMPTADADKSCLTCHRNQRTGAGRLEASHAHNSVSCVACHIVHGPQAMVVRQQAAVNTQCESCHFDVKASFAQPFKHRVPESAMTCVDCHNPHGSLKPGLMQMANANEPGCFNCHGDKRGPFTFEHAPVREEGCQSCHEPHGSANAKMLVRQEVRYVCLECHANLPSLPNTTAAVSGVVPPAFHDLNSPRYRNCTICHQKIHGSHTDRNLLR
jgi:DmsE family decaheme c-type cytochrome